MAQPDINSILAALAQQHSNGTPQVATPQQHPPPGYPPRMNHAQSPVALSSGASYLPQPSSTGSLDLSAIKPVSSGSVSIADAIAKAKNIAADRGMVSYDRQPSGSMSREDSRTTGRGLRRSRSRSPSRRDSYGGNPYRDERREDSNRGGRYRRSPTPDRSYNKGSRDGPSNANRGNNDSETETISVKSNLVGLIIGRNGENMRKIEAESGARVQFIQAKDSRASERMCTISGSPRARNHAKEAIFSIIRDNAGPSEVPDKGAYTPGMPGRAKVNLPAVREGENSTQVMVPDKTVGLIIGRGGETIKDLQEKSGCHVNILGENKSLNGLRPVNLIGSERATQVAKDMILEIVESDTRGGNSSNGPGTGSGSNRTVSQRDRGFDSYNSGNEPGQVKKTIDVPSEAVGMIIGKGGETIKELQKSTGCSINVNQPQRPDITRKIDLAGPAQAVHEAENAIWEKVETVQQRDAQRGGSRHGGGGGGSGAPDHQYDPYSQQQQQQSSSSVPSYAQYLPGGGIQQTSQLPTFQMPAAATAAPGTQQPSDPNQSDPYAPWGGQAAYYAYYYAQQFQQAQQQQQQNGNGAPGT